MQLNTGDKLGNYEILSLLGEGGMGAVYKAKHVELSKIVALKVLKPELLQNKSFLQRFKIEAKAAAKLNHPNIVTVHDIGQEGDINYFILDYVLGEDLEEVIRKQGNLTYEKAKEIIKQIALALDYAHNQGIIHRDIKTRNIMIDEHGNAKLTDFGIARVTEETRLTSTGTFMGTVEYMSSEQAMGKTVDGRSDIYSLGIVFYELVTGDVPFKGDTTPIAVAMKHVNEKVISPRDLNGLIPEIGEKIILRCLEKDPDVRFQTGRELADAIEEEKLKEIKTATGSLIKKNCPYCGEEIMVNAVKCKHCGTFLDKTKHKSTDSSKILVPVLTVSAVVIIGIIATIIIIAITNKSWNNNNKQILQIMSSVPVISFFPSIPPNYSEVPQGTDFFYFDEITIPRVTTEPFMIYTKVSNYTGNNQGGISISFPNNPEVIIIESNSEVAKIYYPGQKLYNEKTDSYVSSKYILAEAWDNYWNSSKKLYLSLRITPKSKGKLRIQVRAAILFFINIPIVGDGQDQQDAHVKYYDVEIN